MLIGILDRDPFAQLGRFANHARNFELKVEGFRRPEEYFTRIGTVVLPVGSNHRGSRHYHRRWPAIVSDREMQHSRWKRPDPVHRLGGVAHVGSRTREIREPVDLDGEVHSHLVHRHPMLGDNRLVGQKFLERRAKVAQFGFRDGGERVQGCLRHHLISDMAIG